MSDKNLYEIEASIKEMIGDLKGLCSDRGLSNSADEEEVVTSVFLYKFLNDKFMYNLSQFSEMTGLSTETILKNENDELEAFYDAFSGDVAFRYEDTIEFLANNMASDSFYQMFDEALIRISDYERNREFSISTDEGGKKPLFTSITKKLDTGKKNPFAQSIFSILTKEKFDFGGVFKENFDFYSTIFETLISDYNKDSGKYAEYYTPQFAASIISTILVNMSEINPDNIYEICDPSAGSGTLVLHLANALGKGSFGNTARVYSQDISNKSTRFLRINMMLNGLTESLHNIVEGNTLTEPAHFNIAGDQSSGLKKFDFLTANPPFKADFSSTRNQIETQWAGTDRFFAGVPKIPNKDKDKMAIYLMFIQHILYSLKDNGKAAIIVPTGFITAKSGIEARIREHMIQNNMLAGVISFPSNIFSNTGTNVSAIFIDKSKKDNKVILMDASNLGTKTKVGKNQKTLLSDEEIKKIIDTFVNREAIDDFSVLVDTDQITDKGWSFSAGQYFDVKIDHIDITADEFKSRIEKKLAILDKSFAESRKLEAEIMKQIGGLKA